MATGTPYGSALEASGCSREEPRSLQGFQSFAMRQNQLSVAVRIDIFPPRYQDVVHLARGGMGDVYRATDTSLGRIVAIKVLSERYAHDGEVRRRFKNEGLAAARLSNAPHTVTIFDVGEAEEQPYIVMEYLEGGSLEDRLSRGQPATVDVLRWLDQAAGALDAGHAAGVVHRDVKPGNLLLNGRDDVYVADFGVASAAGLDSLTVTGTVLGTAGYLSPEQAQGQRATPASDRYALGVVAYELLTGRRPFESENPTAEATAHVTAPVPAISSEAEVPAELDPVFRRALAKEPAARYPSAEAFVADLRDSLSGPAEETAATAALPAYGRAPASRRNRGWLLVLLGALAVALAVGGLALAGVFGGSEPQTRTVVRQTTIQGEPTTVRETVTQQPPPPAPPPPSPPTPPSPTPPSPTPPPAPSARSGQQLTDQATALLGQGRWAEAEQVARQAVQKLNGSGQLYEAYANYDLGRALVEQNRCDEALRYLDRSEQIQGSRREIREARAKCQ
jgi:eukaryotic-like serine/threonine-protein kinase